MEKSFNPEEVKDALLRVWEESGYATPRINQNSRRYSMFLVPPNASGPLHVGNALMIAIQDILARYHRAKGDATLWIPGTDHGGYETQVTFERELEAAGRSKDEFTRTEFVDAVEDFVAKNNETIVRQVKAMGASVDWSRFRYTLDKDSLRFVDRMFRKMIADKLIYRSSYMVNYCSECTTMLADIELKEVPSNSPLYVVKFPFREADGYLPLATTRPEFLFAVTHILVHPRDERYAEHIGSTLLNPVTGEEVLVIESKRKHDPDSLESPLFVFSPSSRKYDFEYAIRNGLPVRNLLDWKGLLIERNPGMTPEEARSVTVDFCTKEGLLERVDEAFEGTKSICKKGHPVESVIRMTWFMRLDDEQVPLRKPALEMLERERLVVQPHWRKKGLADWIGKMHDWPIARQNAWGIRIPIWYEVTDPSLFTVWYRDSERVLRHGNLKALLEEGILFEEVVQGLERVYVAERCNWTLEPAAGKKYLPETDTFDTWFSSGAWSAMVFENSASSETSHAYPSDVLVIGHDLLRLSISREIILGVYMTGRLPFRRVYFHQLLKSADGQKMSKSLGNAITLDTYLEKFGADVTRMALVSYTGLQEDFAISDERLERFKSFSDRLWKIGRALDAITAHNPQISVFRESASLSADDQALLSGLEEVRVLAASSIERYALADAQEKAVSFLPRLEEFVLGILSRNDPEGGAAIFSKVLRSYLMILHPFMPFETEELSRTLYPSDGLLASFGSNTRLH
ncbi:MAG: Valyl-tRNA synthetase [Parcubacteria bacterium C7867-004]|nr:MAG: Valyl-tRNA synthetase [Parcubacteria bacterium C7867-004]